MARIVTISVVVSLLIVVAGCENADASRASRLPPRTTYVAPPITATTPGMSSVVKTNDELALVEQVTKFRQDYRQSLLLLVDHYVSAANNEKLKWVQEELRELDRMRQYTYILDPSILSETLKAMDPNPEADKAFADAYKTQKMAQPLGSRILPDTGQLSIALQKYYALIRNYPTSDKIDDAAWQSAGIYEDLGDYANAILFYKRTFQWDPATTYSPRYEAARLLDKLNRRDEALPLYQEAITKEARHLTKASVAERRVKELTTPKPEAGSR
jgi:tetratricopeptide (TPR) repeat protein